MAAKLKAFSLKGGHTAGIFADMRVDGPVIGTLVAVVDRAKNLPNRKTIGKQDPYCAARLGKEARKTTTDVRGGQTPKWDQELRFTVHDSPDYYQLKMSVFNDDKKTDLIGEAWIDLKSIIVAGGGQSDMWQGLACRGKYAGEIRLEITFYDSRPRPERLATKQKTRPTTEQDSGGSLKQPTPVKRRPLPSDPVTGEPPVTPQEHIHTPPQGARPPTERDPYTPSPHSAHRHGHRARESLGTASRYQDERGYSERAHASPYNQQHARGSHESFSEVHEAPADERAMPSPFHNGTPPPPPAHRTRQNSAGPEAAPHYDISPTRSPMPMRQDVLKSEAHRHSMSSQPGQPHFKAYDPSMSAPMQIASRHSSPHNSPSSQHLSRSPGRSPMYSPHHRSMQPTVEDVPDSPSAGYGQNGQRGSAAPEDLSYHPGPGTSSQIASRSPGAPGQHRGVQSPLYGYNPRGGHPGGAAHPSSGSPLSAMNYSNMPPHAPFDSQPNQYAQRSQHNKVAPLNIRQRSPGHAPPPVPPSLSSGVDLALSQEFSVQGPYNNRRYDDPYRAAQHTTPARGRHHSEEPPSYTANPPQTYIPPSCDGPYRSRPAQQAPRPRKSPSPNPSTQHAVRRKSLSPASRSTEARRSSDIPFGPDSYDAFNTSMTGPGPGPGPVAARTNLGDNATIIGHDGREIDPSDYLPMDTWAPEPEPRGKATEASPEPRGRPSPSRAQPMPPNSRRPLRIATRPRSMPSQQRTPAPPAYGQQTDDGRMPPSGGRSRLQKKAPRASIGHDDPPAAMPSPLTPVSPDRYQERQQGQYASTGSPNPHSGGPQYYPNENVAPQHGSSGPPLPAKVPLPIMSGVDSSGADLYLMEEMQRIDIGTGRSRRRGGGGY